MSSFDPTLLSGYLDDELDASERDRVERALADDPQLRAQYESLRQLRVRLQGLQNPTLRPVDHVARVRDRIDDRKMHLAERGDRDPWSWPRRFVSLAVAAMLLLAIGWTVFQDPFADSIVAVDQGDLAPEKEAAPPPTSTMETDGQATPKTAKSLGDATSAKQAPGRVDPEFDERELGKLSPGEPATKLDRSATDDVDSFAMQDQAPGNPAIDSRAGARPPRASGAPLQARPQGEPQMQPAPAPQSLRKESPAGIAGKSHRDADAVPRALGGMSGRNAGQPFQSIERQSTEAANESARSAPAASSEMSAIPRATGELRGPASPALQAVRPARWSFHWIAPDSQTGPASVLDDIPRYRITADRATLRKLQTQLRRDFQAFTQPEGENGTARSTAAPLPEPPAVARVIGPPAKLKQLRESIQKKSQQAGAAWEPTSSEVPADAPPVLFLDFQLPASP